MPTMTNTEGSDDETEEEKQTAPAGTNKALRKNQGASDSLSS